MKVSGHNKQIGQIYFASDSDGDSDEENTLLRLKANKSRVGRIFSRNRETHDRLTRSLHDAEVSFATAGSSLHALGVTKITDDMANRRADLERHMEKEARQIEEVQRLGKQMLGYHRANVHTSWDKSGASGMMQEEDEGSVEEDEEKNAAPATGSYAELQLRVRDLEMQTQGMKAMLEQQNNKHDTMSKDAKAKAEAYEKMVMDHTAAKNKIIELSKQNEELQRQLLVYLEKETDPNGEEERRRVPQVTSNIAQSICALYEYIRTNSLRLRDVFQGMDRNQNGLLDRDEFVGAMRALNLGFSDWACESIFDQADVDGNGTMNYQEFLHGFRAGVDAYGKENGVMYTFRDMKEAKESLAKKKDQVIMKYRIKWENTTLELEQAQRELKDLKERKLRRQKRKPARSMTTLPRTNHKRNDSIQSANLGDSESEPLSPREEKKESDETKIQDRPRVSVRVSRKKRAKDSPFDTVGPRDIINSAESKAVHTRRKEQQQRRNDEERRGWAVDDEDKTDDEDPRKQQASDEKKQLEDKAKEQPGHPSQVPKLRAIVHIAQLQLKQQKILALKRNARNSAGKLAAQPLVETSLAQPVSAPVVARARPTSGTSRAGQAKASLAKNHLQMLQRQSMELREKDRIITQLYRDVDSKTMAANAAEQRATQASLALKDVESKLEQKSQQLADVHKELQTVLEQHSAELDASDRAIHSLQTALDTAYGELASREEKIVELSKTRRSTSATASSSALAQLSPSRPSTAGSRPQSGRQKGPDMSTIDNEDLFRLVHRMLVDVEKLWRSSSRLLAGDGQGGVSDASGGRGQIRVHLNRLSDQAATVKKAIEQRVPDMKNEISINSSQSLPPDLQAPWRWRDKARFQHANKKWLRPGFGTK